jgi:hypothetical protein
MAKYTNVSRRLIHLGEVALVPGQAVDVSDDLLKMRGLKAGLDRYVKAGDVKAGEHEVKSELPEAEAEEEVAASERQRAPAAPPARR